ncbi:MAG: Holliday junction resolvase RuvX [Opitutaceae bacterium]|nr:Holliday junction resolvase RuvX [Cytophagales bacterium]
MPRILAIDYGNKRCGIAVTDPLQIIATPLDMVRSHLLIDFLKAYFLKENVECVVLGFPTDTLNRDTDSTANVKAFAKHFVKTFPEMRLIFEDEKFTSKMALQSMIAAGTTKAFRKEKGNIDKVSATIILQSYLERKSNGFG